MNNDDAPIPLRIVNGKPNGDGFAYRLGFSNLLNEESPMRDTATVERLPWYAIVWMLPHGNCIWYKAYATLEEAVAEAQAEGLLPDESAEELLAKPQYDQWHSNVSSWLTRELPAILWTFTPATATNNETWVDVASVLNHSSIYSAVSDKVC